MTGSFTLDLGWEDRQLLVDALAMAASRHESMARAQKFGRDHDRKAEQMRALRTTIMRLDAMRPGTKGGPTVGDPDRPYCKPDQSCCDFCCGN